MAKTIVEINDVSLTYHETNGETQAIDHLRFSVERGEFVSIVGPSGCGKTSILSLLAGLLQPSAGNIYIEGRPGYMLQRDHLLDWRTIEGNILLGLQVKGLLNERTRAYALSLLKTYGLYDFLHSYPHQLSGGMRQKVALIRTLACSPELLLLDEPFSALDYQTRLTVADEIYGILRREGKTAILVTHDIAEAISMSDRVLVFTGRPARLKSEHRIALGDRTPLKRRNAPEFKEYFDTIWKELDCYAQI
ncbi:MAG: ABC transporter ATP-binding protein [Christensenellaceae bacterium]|nr:ABC transporter ATP-binding protein [Christensenellaceae bacterium]